MGQQDKGQLKIAIVGAGIGGLTAARALRQRGFAAEIYERATELGEFGAGLQLGPNAIKVLRALGLESETRQIAFEPSRKTIVNWDDGGLRSREVTKGIYDGKYGAPYMTAYRPDLHRMLVETLPAGSIHLGKICTGVKASGETGTAFFADGTVVEADILVGADGIRSTIRRELFGAEEPRFTNMSAWRCIIGIDNVPKAVGPNDSVDLQKGDYFAWYGPTGQVICYPIGDGTRLNIFVGRHSADWVEESWTIPSSPAELLEAFKGWDPAMLRMFEKVEHCYKWGIFDREPHTEWTAGRIVLLGDAAHPTMPTLAQGANMAIEDGYVLARCIDQGLGDLKGALRNFVRERQPRTSRITLQSREHYENAMAVPPRPLMDRSWIFEFDPTRDPVETPQRGAA
jgi:salicylate hydroxylase